MDRDYFEDSDFQKYMKILQRPGPHRSEHLDLSRYEVMKNSLYYNNLNFVPNNPDLNLLIKNYYDNSSSGHHGWIEVFAEILRDYWWPNLVDYIIQFTNNFHICKRITPSRLRYQGLLKQPPIPERCWRDLSVDFISPLPASERRDCIIIVCCRLTKARHFIACNTKIDAAGIANLFYKHIWKHHGFPESIVSDRGPQFVAKFWHEVCERTN